MLKYLKIFVLLIFILGNLFVGIPDASAQQPITITKPDLTFRNDTLIIHYNFQNCTAKQLYTVWIEASTFDGHKFPVNALSGDIGKGVACDSGKIIYWNLAADSVYIDDVVFVKVLAKPPPEKTALQRNQQPNYFLTSMLFPGSGLTMLKKNKKPYWLMGVAGYGGLSSTLFFGQKAKTDYNSYNQETDPDRRKQLYDSYQKNQKIMQISAISTGVIWLTNLIWTAAAPKTKPGIVSLNNKEIQIGTTLFPESFSAGLVLRYQF